jgi:hypothetical protein
MYKKIEYHSKYFKINISEKNSNLFRLVALFLISDYLGIFTYRILDVICAILVSFLDFSFFIMRLEIKFNMFIILFFLVSFLFEFYNTL